MTNLGDKLLLSVKGIIFEHVTKSNASKIVVAVYIVISIFCALSGQFEYWKTLSSFFFLFLCMLLLFLPQRLSTEDHIRKMRELDYKMGHMGNENQVVEGEVVQPILKESSHRISAPKTKITRKESIMMKEKS